MPVLRLLLALCLLLSAAGAHAQTSSGAGGGSAAEQAVAQRAADGRILDQARAQLQQIARESAQSDDDAALGELRTQVLTLQDRVDGVLGTESPRLATLDAYLTQLGPPPKTASLEGPTVRQLRTTLTRAREATDALVKQGRLLTVAAGQSAERIAERRRALFNERLFRRAPSPLSPQLWAEIGQSLPGDAQRLQRLTAQSWAAAARAATPQRGAVLAAALALAALMVGPLRLWLELVGRRRATAGGRTRLRESGLAVWLLAVGTLLPAAGAWAVQQALDWGEWLSPQAAELAGTLTGLAGWVAFLSALGRAALQPRRPEWRLMMVSDRGARRLTAWVWAVAVTTSAGALLERVDALVGASLAATVGANCVLAIAYALAAGSGLALVGRGRRAARASAEAPTEGAVAPLQGLLSAGLGLAAVAALIGALLGYFALAYLVARQTIWIGVVGALLLVLLRFTDDLFTAAIAPETRVGRGLRVLLGLRATTVAQLGVLASGLARVLLLLLGLSAVTAPLGTDPGQLVGQFTGVATGFKLGGATVSPLALAGGLGALLVGLALVRGVQRWLNDRYLPATDWDTGVRASVSTGLGYLGVTLAGAWALTVMGVGLQRIALIASALSVGIGFGLQAIVSNFISGLILLVERPVKVGDWVAVGDNEGDVRRISVRATEIAMFDRSTLIVPNSEFVTKTVRNVTLAGALGRVAIKLTVALDADPQAARGVMLEALAAHPDVLDDPAPGVFLEAVTDSGVVLQSFSYVAGPRQAYGVRSAVLFDMLRRLREAGVKLAQAGAQVRVDLGEHSPVPEAAPPPPPSRTAGG